MSWDQQDSGQITAERHWWGQKSSLTITQSCLAMSLTFITSFLLTVLISAAAAWSRLLVSFLVSLLMTQITSSFSVCRRRWAFAVSLGPEHYPQSSYHPSSHLFTSQELPIAPHWPSNEGMQEPPHLGSEFPSSTVFFEPLSGLPHSQLPPLTEPCTVSFCACVLAVLPTEDILPPGRRDQTPPAIPQASFSGFLLPSLSHAVTAELGLTFSEPPPPSA